MPEGTAGLVLLVDDPDAPVEGSFVHWVLYNLDPARRGIAESEVPAEAERAMGNAALQRELHRRRAVAAGDE